jgi:hypothetical protein
MGKARKRREQEREQQQERRTLAECVFCHAPYSVKASLPLGLIEGLTCSRCNEPLTLRLPSSPDNERVFGRPVVTPEQQAEINERGMAKVRAAQASAKRGVPWDGWYTYRGKREWVRGSE